MTESDRPPIAEGDILVGRYRVERILGVGGMGVVVSATQLDLERRVAIKILLRSALESPGALERFAREGRALSKLTTEHVTRVLEVGELESGLPFLVMEHLEGTDLAALLSERGPFSVAMVADMIAQACAGLADAHENGIVHRDLKPSNLYLATTPKGLRLKVLDFGISKVMGPQSKVVTTDTEVLGSPLYMSPEQLSSTRELDARSDIWALGVVMFELLAGSVPFDGESFAEICTRILHAPAPRLDRLRLDVPKSFADVVARCLAKDPRRRWRSVSELAGALMAFGTEAENARTTARTKRERPPFFQPGRVRIMAGLMGAASLTGLLSIVFQEEGARPLREQRRAEIVSVRSADIVTTADSATMRGVSEATTAVDARSFVVRPTTLPVARPTRRDEPDLGY